MAIIDIEKNKEKWQKEAYVCHMSSSKEHDWIPTSWITPSGSKHVTAFTCVKCFHHVNVEDFHRYRKPIPLEEISVKSGSKKK